MHKILVVEDEAAIALDIVATLKKLGYDNVRYALSPGEASQLFQKTDPDIVFMDINLGDDTDGIMLAESFRQSKSFILIYLTAYTDESVVDRAAATGPDGYIVKPFKRSDIDIGIKLALKKKETSPPSQNQEGWKAIGSGYLYNPKLKNLTYHGHPVELTKKELLLFHLCFEYRGNIVPIEMVDEIVWPEKAVTDSTRRSLSFRLRVKLNNEFFESIPGVGYRLNIKK